MAPLRLPRGRVGVDLSSYDLNARGKAGPKGTAAHSAGRPLERGQTVLVQMVMSSIAVRGLVAQWIFSCGSGRRLGTEEGRRLLGNHEVMSVLPVRSACHDARRVSRVATPEEIAAFGLARTRPGPPDSLAHRIVRSASMPFEGRVLAGEANAPVRRPIELRCRRTASMARTLVSSRCLSVGCPVVRSRVVPLSPVGLARA